MRGDGVGDVGIASCYRSYDGPCVFCKLVINNVLIYPVRKFSRGSQLKEVRLDLSEAFGDPRRPTRISSGSSYHGSGETREGSFGTGGTWSVVWGRRGLPSAWDVSEDSLLVYPALFPLYAMSVLRTLCLLGKLTQSFYTRFIQLPYLVVTHCG